MHGALRENSESNESTLWIYSKIFFGCEYTALEGHVLLLSDEITGTYLEESRGGTRALMIEKMKSCCQELARSIEISGFLASSFCLE